MTLQDLQKRYNAAVEARDEALAALDAAPDTLTVDEVDALSATVDGAQGEVERAKEAMEKRSRIEEARAASTAIEVDVNTAEKQVRSTAIGDVKVLSEPMTYGRSKDEAREGRVDFFRDLALASLPGRFDAQARIQRHSVETRAVDRTDTTSGGDLVPPKWIFDEIALLARAGRVTADLVRSIPLPPGTDSVRFPKITTGTAVAIQTADNASLTSTDMVANTVTAPVVTVGGIQDVALQLIDQSPMNITDLVLGDLAADYARKLDDQVINGSGSSGQMLGILNTSSITATTYTDATPTAAELYPFLSDNIRDVLNARYIGGEVFVWNPKMWYFFVKSLDSSSRPFVTFNANGPFNAYGSSNSASEVGLSVQDNLQSAYAGNFMGVPVFLDPNVPTNLGAGTNETRSILMNRMDNILMEGTAHASVHPDSLANTMTMRFRFYRYAAFTAGRFAPGNGVVSGTGMILA